MCVNAARECAVRGWWSCQVLVCCLLYPLETQTRVVCQCMQPTASVPCRASACAVCGCCHRHAAHITWPLRAVDPTRPISQGQESKLLPLPLLLLHSLPQMSVCLSARATHSHNTPACLFVVVLTLQTTRRISLRVAVQQVRAGRGRCWVSRMLQAVSIHSACLVLPSGSKRARSGPSRLSHALTLEWPFAPVVLTVACNALLRHSLSCRHQ